MSAVRKERATEAHGKWTLHLMTLILGGPNMSLPTEFGWNEDVTGTPSLPSYGAEGEGELSLRKLRAVERDDNGSGGWRGFGSSELS